MLLLFNKNSFLPFLSCTGIRIVSKLLSFCHVLTSWPLTQTLNQSSKDNLSNGGLDGSNPAQSNPHTKSLVKSYHSDGVTDEFFEKSFKPFFNEEVDE